MKGRTVILAGAVAVLAAPPAMAQTDDGTSVGGDVHSTLELILSPSTRTTFATFGKAKTYSATIKLAATSTQSAARLSVADGDVLSGAKLGHLTAGAKRLPKPLEVSVEGAFAPLDTTPEVARWGSILANEPATLRLRQRITAKSGRTYHKVLLVTLSTETP